ncbi:hypothetical protein H920_16644 [Fukomys damarensis]|uniref:Uncharacterized protein n=1 Tax=Fukomys damarensis TaxID=885580 RepID=A0A091CRS8_FUKDA|nr:hypothetical protein H920_16644 [Fukomys damarensis]
MHLCYTTDPNTAFFGDPAIEAIAYDREGGGLSLHLSPLANEEEEGSWVAEHVREASCRAAPRDNRSCK